jgi:hypothetical protein
VLLQLVQDSIPVAVDTLAAVEILVAVDTLVVADTLAAVEILVVVDNPVVADTLAAAHTPGVEILEVAFVVQPCRIVVAHVDQD